MKNLKLKADMFENSCRPGFVSVMWSWCSEVGRQAGRSRTVDLLSIVYGWPAQSVAREQHVARGDI